MVSQPEPPPPSSSLTIRGPSSVTSSHRGLSRSRRLNRSHAGGASYVPQNEFPVFGNSGDVEILVRAGHVENRYLLHRHNLTRCSGFFEASTSSEWSKAKALPAGNELTRVGDVDPARSLVDGERGGRTAGGLKRVGSDDDHDALDARSRKRWRYELDYGDGDNDIPMLVQKDPSEAVKTKKVTLSTVPSIFGPGPSPRGVSFAQDRDNHTSSSRTKGGHSHSSSTSSNHHFFRSVANLSLSHQSSPSVSAGPVGGSPLSQDDEDILRDYDNLFRIFYNYPPVMDGINVADAYVQCKSLLNLADQYDALAVVGPRVDHHLLQFQSRLWKQIAKYPISYLRLGYLARSKVIFQEALVHVVGQWPAGERSLRSALPELVLDIIEDKVDELEEIVSRVEGRLFRLGLTTSRGERVTPQTNYLDWLAISLFRQWLADNTTPQPPPPRFGNSSSDRRRPGSSRSGGASAAPPPPHTSVGRAYRTLGSGNPSSFLGHDECKRFLKLTPEMYSRDNLRRFEKRLDELKAMARDIVRPLMASGLELDMGGSSRTAEGIGYLTCTAVGDRDLPWPMDD